MEFEEMEMELAGNNFEANGKSDEAFVNDKIKTLRKMRDDYQAEINNVNVKY